MSARAAAVLLAAALSGCATANVAVNRGFDFSSVRRVAVVGFRDYPRQRGSGAVVSGAFEQALLAAGYDVVERAQVDDVVRESALEGSLDDSARRELGRRLKVDALVFGQVTDLQKPRERLMQVDVVDDRTTPVYERRSRRVQKDDGTEGEMVEDVVTGYQTAHVVRREPRQVTVDGRLGVAARMVDARTGAVLWSGSDSARAFTLEDAARGLADGILKAVKPTWPASSAR